MQMIRKDNYLFGAMTGFLIPLALFGLILIINFVLIQIGIADSYLDRKIHLLISMTGNLLPIRYYFVSLKLDKTGRGVLLITFILFMLFFAFKDKLL